MSTPDQTATPTPAPVLSAPPTVDQMIAYLRARGWTVKRESRSRWAFGYYCYKLRMEGNRERHDDGSSLKVAFVNQIMADTNAVFAALDAS